MSNDEGVKETTRDLYKLVGNYEATTKTIFNRLEKIDKTNGKILDSIQTINSRCAERGKEIDQASEAITALEERDQSELSRNSKLQILANFGISFVNIIITALTKLTGG